MPQISKQAREEWFRQSVDIKPELEKIFGPLLPQITVLDIGACEGLSSLRYAYHGVGGRFILFEPLPANVQLIQDNIQTFSGKVPGRFDVMPFALGASDGKQTFWASYGDVPGMRDWNPGNKSSSLLEPTGHLQEHRWCKFDTTEVPVSTLDSLHLEADFIHMDVQGAEMLVLEGGEQTVSGARAVWCEVAKIELYAGQPLEHDLTQWFIKHGFKPAKICMANDKWGDVLYTR